MLAGRWQRRRRGDRRQRRDGRRRPSPVRSGRRPVRRSCTRRTSVAALNASGRAGLGCRPRRAARRRTRRDAVPPRHPLGDACPAASTAGSRCTSGSARSPLADVLAPAIRLAEHGFPASPLLVGSLATIDDAARANLARDRRAGDARRGTRAPARRRPGPARRSPPTGADGFYGGEFGDRPARRSAAALHAEPTSTARRPTGSTPLTADAFGVELHTIPPNSQGYLTLAARAAGRARSASPTIPTTRNGRTC